MKNKSVESKVRINLDMSPQFKERLNDLQIKTDAASYSEVIRRALALYAMVIDSGSVVMLKNADGNVIEAKIL